MMVWSLVGCSRLSGLFVQSVEAAGPDGVHERGPIGFAGYCVLDFPWVSLLPFRPALPSHHFALTTL